MQDLLLLLAAFLVVIAINSLVLWVLSRVRITPGWGLLVCSTGSLLALLPALIWQETWTIALLGISLAGVVGSIFFMAEAYERRASQRALERRERLRRPPSAEEVAEGLNWKEIERWLSNY